MKKLTLEDFNYLLENTPMKPRLKREIRFIPSTQNITDQDWLDYEMLAVTDRSGNKGVLVINIEELFYLLPYEISRGITSSTGRAQPIICDLCRTWQTGSRSGSILFPRDRNGSAVGYLCCADLQCSNHVRSKTFAARTSRSQLREDLSDEERVTRFRGRLQEIVTRLRVEPITLV